MEPPEPQTFKTRKRREGGRTGRLINFTCYHNQPLLASARCCVWTLHAIDRARTLHNFHLWAYCLMPNHVHLLLRPAEGTLVGSILTSIKQSVANQAITWTKKYAPHFLPCLTHTGSDGRKSLRFWQRGGGYDRNLWSPRHIWEAVDYIHANPVEGGLCDRSAAWVWSSVRYYRRRFLQEVPCPCPEFPGVVSLRPDAAGLPRDPR